MVVIPVSTLRFERITQRRVRIEAGVDIEVVMVFEQPRSPEVAGKTIAL